MQTLATTIIDALGGTTAVSRMTDVPLSTVHSWRRNGIPRSRLAHLRLAAKTEAPTVDLDRVIVEWDQHGLGISEKPSRSSPGDYGKISGPQVQA